MDSHPSIEYYVVQSNVTGWRSIRFYCGDDPAEAAQDAEALRDRLGTYDYCVVGIPRTHGDRSTLTIFEYRTVQIWNTGSILRVPTFRKIADRDRLTVQMALMSACV